MHIPFSDASSVSSMDRFIRFTISSASSAWTSIISCVESNFRFFVGVCVLVTVCDDVSWIVDDGVVTIDDVVVLLSHNIADSTTQSTSIDFSSRFDPTDDCDRLDTVNAETVEAKLSNLLNVPLSVSKMNDESNDAVPASG